MPYQVLYVSTLSSYKLNINYGLLDLVLFLYPWVIHVIQRKFKM